MKLRTSLQTYNGVTLTTDLIGIGLVLTVDGTPIINSVDLSLEAYPTAPVTTTNGYEVRLSTEGISPLRTLTINITNLEPYQSTDVKFEVTCPTFEPLTRTFKVFGYDLGNGIGSLGNPDFKLLLMSTATAATTGNARIIAYREPFTKRIRYYNGSTSTVTFYDFTSGSLVSLGSTPGFVASSDETILKVYNTVTGGTQIATVTVPAAQWTPSFDLSVDAPVGCVDEDCYTILSQFSALASIDFSTAYQVNIDDVASYGTNKFEIRYRIYDSGGSVVSEKSFGFKKVVATPYTASNYEWTTAQLPAEGSYFVEGCLIGVGVPEGDTINSGSGVSLTEGNWYRIVTAGGGAENFLIAGSSSNIIGTEFMSNGVQPTWDGAAVETLGDIFECCTRERVLGCSPYKIEQAACNEYTITNNSLSTISVRIKAMNTDGVFETITDGEFTVNVTESRTDSFALDNIYIYEVYDNNGVLYTKVIFNYCSLRTCLLDYINDLICKCVPSDDCTNYCKDFYNFNALVVVAHTYFNMLNQEYNFNFSYTTLDPSKVSELYSAKQVLDRFADYCESCTSCSCTTNNCSCK